MLMADAAAVADADGTGVLCVADEIFLPQINGSAQVSTGVAQSFNNAGRMVCSLSFYRDPAAAGLNSTLGAYQTLFKDLCSRPDGTVAADRWVPQVWRGANCRAGPQAMSSQRIRFLPWPRGSSLMHCSA